MRQNRRDGTFIFPVVTSFLAAAVSIFLCADAQAQEERGCKDGFCCQPTDPSQGRVMAKGPEVPNYRWVLRAEMGNRNSRTVVTIVYVAAWEGRPVRS